MVETNFERDKKFNQQLDLYNEWPREGRSSETMHVCLQGEIQSYGSLEKLRLIIAVIRDLQNKEMIWYIWDKIESTRTMKYLLWDASNPNTRVQQLDFIGEFLQANVTHRVLVKLDNRYGEYFP